MRNIRRRDVLAGAAALIGAPALGHAESIAGHLPWHPNAGAPPKPAGEAGWKFFTASEAAVTEALADRIIPPDSETPGGKDAGCAVFVDRQLAGPYGQAQGLYEQPPFIKGEKSQGPQDGVSPADQYRKGVAAIDAAARTRYGGRGFAELKGEEHDRLLSDIESGAAQLDGVDGPKFFDAVIKDIQTGFFADPIYGGNRDMVGWKMIGFPGARYDYRDWVTRHNERYPGPPVSIQGRREWTRKD